MKLNELFEDSAEVAIIFGRFNPPHVGHVNAWRKASESSKWYVGTNQTTVGPTDPLPYDVKIAAMEAMMPEIKGHIVPEQSWWTLATYVYKKHGEVNLYIVTDEKDAKIFVPGLKDQNGKESRHGYYNFKSIEWRPADRITSATDLRSAVLDGDRDKFATAAGVDADKEVMGMPFFDLVAKYLLPYADQIKAKAERAAKKKKTDEVIEGKFRKVDIEEKLIPDDKLDDLKSKYLPDWEMLDHKVIQAKYLAKDHRHAEDFVSYINKISEEMDHFAEVTQDVAEVTVKTTTFDVKGLTILDFKLALKVDKFADDNEIEQVRMQGNFGMHESSYGRYWCSTDKKWKYRKGPKQKRSS